MKVRHFLGCDPCAKPAPNPSHVWFAEDVTRVGIKEGRTYVHKIDDLAAKIRKDGSTWVISVDRERGRFSHVELFTEAGQASDRWLTLCQAA